LHEVSEPSQAAPVDTALVDRDRTDSSPCAILCHVAPHVLPTLHALAERTWPSEIAVSQRRWGVLGKTEIVRERVGPRYRIILRRRDLSTLEEDWRLEAGGPVEFFDWDASGRILGPYGIRYPNYSIRPVFDEMGRWCGFALNARPLVGPERRLQAVDARLDAPVFIRSTEVSDLVEALSSLEGKPRIDESRPGLDPTHAYFDLLRMCQRETYFKSRGVNAYVPRGWTPDTLQELFGDSGVRAVWLGEEDAPRPEAH